MIIIKNILEIVLIVLVFLLIFHNIYCKINIKLDIYYWLDFLKKHPEQKNACFHGASIEDYFNKYFTSGLLTKKQFKKIYLKWRKKNEK